MFIMNDIVKPGMLLFLRDVRGQVKSETIHATTGESFRCGTLGVSPETFKPRQAIWGKMHGLHVLHSDGRLLEPQYISGSLVL